MPIAIASRSCSAAASGPSVRTVELPPCASTMRTASSTAHSSCGLTVNPRYRVSISCSSAVRVTRPPVAGTRLTQTRTFTLSPGSGRCPGRTAACCRRRRRSPGSARRSTRPPAWCRPGLLGRQVGHQQVLADRRPRPGARHVRPAALRVDERLAVGRQDRLATQHVALDAGRRRRVVDGQRAQDRRRGLARCSR